MKTSIYLKSGSVITYNAYSTPELIISEFSGKLLSYEIKDISSNVRPLYIDPSEISAIVVEISESE